MRPIQPLGKKIKKKRSNLTRVKITKLMTLIVRPRYSHKKHIKTDYEAQFSTNLILNDKIKKINHLNKRQKKKLEST